MPGDEEEVFKPSRLNVSLGAWDGRSTEFNIVVLKVGALGAAIGIVEAFFSTAHSRRLKEEALLIPASILLRDIARLELLIMLEYFSTYGKCVCKEEEQLEKFLPPNFLFFLFFLPFHTHTGKEITPL